MEAPAYVFSLISRCGCAFRVASATLPLSFLGPSEYLRSAVRMFACVEYLCHHYVYLISILFDTIPFSRYGSAFGTASCDELRTSSKVGGREGRVRGEEGGEAGGKGVGERVRGEGVGEDGGKARTAERNRGGPRRQTTRSFSPMKFTKLLYGTYIGTAIIAVVAIGVDAVRGLRSPHCGRCRRLRSFRHDVRLAGRLAVIDGFCPREKLRQLEFVGVLLERVDVSQFHVGQIVESVLREVHVL